MDDCVDDEVLLCMPLVSPLIAFGVFPCLILGPMSLSLALHGVPPIRGAIMVTGNW